MIYIVVAIISFLIGLLITIIINEWLADLSMKRLSLKRDRKHDIIEISDDDDSFDASPTAGNYTRQNKYVRTDNDSSLMNVYDSNPVHDTSDNDVIEAIPSTSKGSISMFHWNKDLTSQVSQYQDTSKGDDFLDSGLAPMHVDVCNSDHNNLVTLNDIKKETSPPQVMIHYNEEIAGTKVKFPVKPYPSQKSVMNQLISGCNKEENCLIESPTGSGKTLALLCGALAWQEQYGEKILKGCNVKDNKVKDNNVKDNNDMDIGTCCGKDGDTSYNLPFNNCDKIVDKAASSHQVPKVFYCTRTHKQIEQIVKELRSTVYKNKRMTILSSRTHTCIQKTNRNKDELCNELLDPKKFHKCPYYKEDNKKDMASFEAVKRLGLETPWDIEDLVSLGKQIEACPYFAARSLMCDAEIIMCPYNYIIDPRIRERMQINLKGHIIILDEAHNIENNCRDAASVNIKDINLAIASKECEDLSHKRDVNQYMYQVIYKYLHDVIKFLGNVEVKTDGNSKMISNQWLGVEFLELLNIEQIGRDKFPDFLAASEAAIRDFNESKEISTYHHPIIPTITFETKAILEELCLAIETIASETFVNDYRVYVTETEEFKNMRMHENTWMSARDKHQRIRVLYLQCMNPAVAFTPITRTARSVILASGTLTPITTFQSELGVQFPHKLRASHIIPKEQVYVRCISRGPSGKSLIANYKNVNSWTFQNELGNLVLQVCDAVPYGVLCFFSSYSAMNSIHDRWKQTGIWAKLAKLKEIFVEPRDAKDLPEIMKQYSEVIQGSLSQSYRENCGAIMFAVFRGKVAEGTDFRDNEARCVLTIGIPYTYKMDMVVSMKMAYNDSNMSKGLLPGSEWYNVDAFRALNQALGRCIRHIDDWGAVLMVDERLQYPRYAEYLPKWIKDMKKSGTNDYSLKVELENFVARQAARETGNAYVEEKGLKGYMV